MPSPFPGMDPYLEDPLWWPSVHQRLITYIGDTLGLLLPPQYIANIGERLYVVQPERNIYPDVAIFESPRPRRSAGPEPATAVAPDAPWVLIVEPVEMREVFIEILALSQGDRVVTIIEVLSFANKTANSEGRRLYLTKQQEVLNSPVHLLEIDLLRSGEHTVAPPRDALLQRGRWDGLISLHRGGAGERYEVWPVLLRQRLPNIRIPLAGDDPDVALDLQSLFDRCYDSGPYPRRLDYRRPPHVPLSSDDDKWAEALLREKGYRSQTTS